ncbi:hypothetical protein ACTZWW_05315 [Salinarimonas sp. NSM]|uniref:hypothetical protein n=1 Tax=Salinarimonas sp. NSM TaxID=3458003 RepID=UPI004036DC01
MTLATLVHRFGEPADVVRLETHGAQQTGPTLPLAEIADALRHAERSGRAGKILLAS